MFLDSWGGGGLTFHILTIPSLEPVAIRWKLLPQLGAHATLVTANAVSSAASPAAATLEYSAAPDPERVGRVGVAGGYIADGAPRVGSGASTRRVIGRRCDENCTSLMTPLTPAPTATTSPQ